MNTESIFAALFAELQKVAPNFKTLSRRIKHIDALQPSDFPAVFQVQGDQIANSRAGLPTIWTLTAEWWLYFYEGNENLAISSQMNPALDYLRGLLDPQADGISFKGLDGLAYRASISGNVEVVEGILGDRGLAVVPIKIIRAER